jgi:AraC family transcriptional regulator
MVTGPEGRRRAATRAASASVGNGNASFSGPHVAVGNLRVSQTAREMIEDCAERPPDLTQLAEASALSKFHLLRLFAETFGATPLEYAQLRRVERAKDLLRLSRLSIIRIAETLGYESQSAFGRTFRRHSGTTPRAFRSGERT